MSDPRCCSSTSVAGLSAKIHGGIRHDAAAARLRNHRAHGRAKCCSSPIHRRSGVVMELDAWRSGFRNGMLEDPPCAALTWDCDGQPPPRVGVLLPSVNTVLEQDTVCCLRHGDLPLHRLDLEVGPDRRRWNRRPAPRCGRPSRDLAERTALRCTSGSLIGGGHSTSAWPTCLGGVRVPVVLAGRPWPRHCKACT